MKLSRSRLKFGLLQVHNRKYKANLTTFKIFSHFFLQCTIIFSESVKKKKTEILIGVKSQIYTGTN